MTTQYTTILKLALPVQGELSGTWGDVVNNNITQMVEQAVAGKAVINTWTGNSHTLTTADGTTSESRCAILELTDSGTALTGAGTVVCPTNTKLYIVDNNTAEIITIQTAAGTGVAVPVGKTMLVYCDGTNVVEGVTHANSLSLGTSTVTADKILDEDNMASDSATAIATQQSIKAYVDSQVGTVDTLSEILANGNTTGANDIDVDSAQKVQFRDADIYLNSSVDGQLDIVADTEIQIAATTVDLNGDLDVSGTALVAGVLTTTAATVFNGGFASNADSTLGTDKKVQFRDAAIYLNSSVDGQLDIVADGEVQIDTALVDINGNLDVSGTTNISGSVSFTKNAIAGVAISTTSRASNTVTVTTSAVHGLTSGDLVNVNGVADTSFNGYFTVSVSSTTVFTYSQTGADGSSTGGTSTEVVYNLNASGTALNWMNGPLNIAANSGIDGLEITQSGAGNGLHVTGTTGLVGNTTLTGNLDVSGTALVTGVLTTTAATVFNGGFASNADSTLGTDKKVQFRDSAIYINSSVDGQLDIVADTEIQIAATTVDLNGNLDVSGTALVTGVLTTTAATVFNGGFASNADSTLGTDKKVQFRDSAIYINSSVDGQLDLVADTEIQIAATTIDVNGTLAFDSLKGTGATTVTNILDEDNMASDSATAIATQQSIKAYVDSQVGTVDTLSEILANGNTTGSTDIAVDSAQKVQFRDAAIYINSSVDGQLDIVADTEIQIAATTIDIDGAVDMASTLKVGGTVLATSAALVNSTSAGGFGFASNNTAFYSFGADTSTAGSYTFQNLSSNASVNVTSLSLSSTGAVFNEGGVDADFRVESTGNANMLFVDASTNRVGVGMSTPIEPLHATGRILSTTTYGGSTQRIGTSIGQNGNTRADIDFRRWTGAAANHGVGMIDVADTGVMAFYTDSKTSNTPATTERMSLDASGNLAIANGNQTAATVSSRIMFGNKGTFTDSGVGRAEICGVSEGALWYSGTALAFYTNPGPDVTGTAPTERMRLNASGNLLVGKTASNSTVAGAQLNANGLIIGTTSETNPLLLNRLSTDGNIITMQKDGATKGSIGTTTSAGGTRFAIGAVGDPGIIFAGTGVFPATEITAADNATDLGSGNYRWKDLYLSGGAYLGGTAAANKLDDYESGTFVPTVTNSNGNMSGISYVSQGGYYQKIGDLAWFRIQVGFSATTIGTGNFRVTGLPYASINESPARQQATVLTYNLDWDAIWKQIHTEGVQNTTSIDFLISRDNAVWANLQADDMADGITYYYIISGCYVTN
jgi:hypothetical protein